MNAPGIIGLGAVVKIAGDELKSEAARLSELRERFYVRLRETVDDIELNGPA